MERMFFAGNLSYRPKSEKVESGSLELHTSVPRDETLGILRGPGGAESHPGLPGASQKWGAIVGQIGQKKKRPRITSWIALLFVVAREGLEPPTLRI